MIYRQILRVKKYIRTKPKPMEHNHYSLNPQGQCGRRQCSTTKTYPWHIVRRPFNVITTPPIPVMLLLQGVSGLSLTLFRFTCLMINIILHDLVEVRFVDHCAGLGALGLLLKILAKEVKVEFPLFDLRASL